MRLSYRDGDRNDIVVSAEAVSLGTELLIGLLVPAIQAVVPLVEQSAGKLPAPTTPISAPPPPKK